MSLILEALKKSERQRRLGESPSLGSPVIAVRRRRNFLPILIVLIAIGLLALWWMRRDGGEPVPAVETATDPAATTSRSPSAPARVADATTFNDAPLPPLASTPNSVPARPGNTQAAAADAERRRKLRDGELVAANPEAGAAATMKESEPVSAADPAALAAAMADAGTPVATKSTAGDRSDRRVADKEGDASAAPAPARADGLKLMWELPLATRRELPEIKVSMHVFARDPAQRFVIINDERHVQGDDIEGMVLLEIRADGVVFEHENVRFLYPRGGR